MPERDKLVLGPDPYGEDGVKAAGRAAVALRERFGRHVGVMDIREGIYHMGVEVHVHFLTEDFLHRLDPVIPQQYEGFHVRRHTPFWSTGDLCSEYKQKVSSFGVVAYGTEEQRDRDAFFDLVVREERKKWAGMSSSERREFVDDLIATRRARNFDLGNCYANWREQEF